MEESTPKCKYLKKMYVIDEHLEMRFMMIRAIRIETVFGTTKIQSKKSNNRKRLSKSQQNPEWIQVLHKE